MYVTCCLSRVTCFSVCGFRAPRGQDGGTPRTNPYYLPISYTSYIKFISLNVHLVFSLASKVGDTARELAVRNGFKKIAKLLAPFKGDTIKVSASLTLKKSAILDF